MRYYHAGLNLTNETVSWHGQHIKPQHQSNIIPVQKHEYIELYSKGYFNNQVNKRGSDGEILMIGVEYITDEDINQKVIPEFIKL